MFDLTSSKLLILAVVALLVVGPKDFPILLRTVGRYLGILRKHAAEFRSQFDEAIREAELDQMRNQVEQMSRDIEKTVREADAKVASDLSSVGNLGQEAEQALAFPPKRPNRVQIPEPPAPAPAVSEAASSAPIPTDGTPATPATDATAPASPAVEMAETPAQPPLPRPGALASAAPLPAPAPADAPADKIAHPAETALASAERSA